MKGGSETAATLGTVLSNFAAPNTFSGLSGGLLVVRTLVAL
jgi:hypothetical protein